MLSMSGLHEKLQHPGQTADDFMVEIVNLEDDTDKNDVYYKYNSDDDVKQVSSDNIEIVEDGVYWSKIVEDNIAPGLDDDLMQAELVSLRTRTVSSVTSASRSRCGRHQSRFITFSDGVHACARYREPDHQLVLGELMSFYMARLLGINNVPAVVLSQVDPNHPVWRDALDDVRDAHWRLGSMVALVQWIPHLVRDSMPGLLRQALVTGTTLDTGVVPLHELSAGDAADLAQWSDLVVFDYVTGIYDRVTSMQVSHINNIIHISSLHIGVELGDKGSNFFELDVQLRNC